MSDIEIPLSNRAPSYSSTAGLMSGADDYDQIEQQKSYTSFSTVPVPSPGRLEHSSYSAPGLVDRLWIFEIICLFVSAACIVAIAIILKKYDGKPLSSWDFYFSVNTVTSVLGGTIARTAIMFAVSTALGQGKWNTYRKRPTPLLFFNSVDKASRGPYGSMMLLFHLRKRYLLMVGAVTTLLSLLVEPALQALITTTGIPQAAEQGTAMISTTATFVGGFETPIEATQIIGEDGNMYTGVVTFPDFGINAALYAGLQSTNLDTSSTLSFTCPTGNCTWPVKTAIAVCSACFDVSSYVTLNYSGMVHPDAIDHASSGNSGELSGNGTQYALPYLGLSITNFDGSVLESSTSTYMAAVSSSDPALTVNFQDWETLLVAITIMEASESCLRNESDWQDSPPVATECGLWLCLNAYSSSVSNGTLSEEVLQSSSKKIPASWEALPISEQPAAASLPNTTALGTLDWNPIYHSGYVTRYDFQLDPSDFDKSWYEPGDTFNASQAALDSTSALLASIYPLPKNATTVAEGVYWMGKEGLVYSTQMLQPLWNSTDLTATFDTLAKSLSVAIRNGANDVYPGQTMQWVIQYRIRWAYFSLPVAIVLGGTIFTLLSIIETWRASVAAWKSSSLATMAYGIDADTRTHLRETCRTQPLDKASSINVRMWDTSDGMELVRSAPMGL